MRAAASALTALVLLASGLALAAQVGTADHVVVNDQTFPHGACERVCIPAIVAPRFAGQPYLAAGDLVVGVELAGDVRAYPLEVLVWHEIVNDIVGGQPVAVTFCPLCGSSVVYDRVVRNETLTFQTSGRLHRSDLVMLDDETRSLWPQILGEAVLGPMHGARLQALPSTVTTWKEWRDAHPSTLLLARPRCGEWPYEVSGCGLRGGQDARDYGRDPYGGYAENRRIGISGEQRGDERGLHPKAPVVGLFLGEVAKSWAVESAQRERVLNDQVGTQHVVVTALQGVRVFAREEGQRFAAHNATHMRDQLGQAWAMATGEGPGGRLELLPTIATFWFAWLDFHPSTLLYGTAGVRILDPAPRVPRDAAVVLAFTHAMDRASVERGLVVDPAHPVTLEWASDQEVRVVPGEPWAQGRAYTLRFESGASQDGLPLRGDARFRAEGGFDAPGAGAVVVAIAAVVALALAARAGWLRPRRP